MAEMVRRTGVSFDILRHRRGISEWTVTLMIDGNEAHVVDCKGADSLLTAVQSLMQQFSPIIGECVRCRVGNEETVNNYTLTKYLNAVKESIRRQNMTGDSE